MPSSTVENYVKQIYLEANRSGDPRVSTGTLAQSMGVVPGTATAMVKNLAETGYVDHEPRGGFKLTDRGEELALAVLRRHRLVELFLVEVLGLDWSEVHVEAEALEHVISDHVLERIDELLGHPRVDPHGDPIPSARGHVEEPFLVSLSEWDPGTRCLVSRVSDQDPAFLQYLHRSGLVPGAQLEVTERISAADALVIALAGDKRVTLSFSAARKILVERLP